MRWRRSRPRPTKKPRESPLQESVPKTVLLRLPCWVDSDQKGRAQCQVHARKRHRKIIYLVVDPQDRRDCPRSSFFLQHLSNDGSVVVFSVKSSMVCANRLPTETITKIGARWWNYHGVADKREKLLEAELGREDDLRPQRRLRNNITVQWDGDSNDTVLV